MGTPKKVREEQEATWNLAEPWFIIESRSVDWGITFSMFRVSGFWVWGLGFGFGLQGLRFRVSCWQNFESGALRLPPAK